MPKRERGAVVRIKDLRNINGPCLNLDSIKKINCKKAFLNNQEFDYNMSIR
jgi:hypothetical protein